MKKLFILFFLLGSFFSSAQCIFTFNDSELNSEDAALSLDPESTPDGFFSKFSPNKLFPGWDERDADGIIGTNQNGEGNASLDKGSTKLLLYFIPKFTSILLKIVAPVIVFMFIFAGVRFIYAGDDEEQIKASKTFFQYGVMGLIFIVFSFSVMKAIYYVLSDKNPSVAIELNIDLESIKTIKC